MDVGAASAFGCDGLRACAGVDVCPQPSVLWAGLPGSVAALTNTEGPCWAPPGRLGHKR